MWSGSPLFHHSIGNMSLKELLLCFNMDLFGTSSLRLPFNIELPSIALVLSTIRTSHTTSNQPITNQLQHPSINSVYPPKCLPATATPPRGPAAPPPHRAHRSIPVAGLLETGGWVTNSTHPRSSGLLLLGHLLYLPREDKPPHAPHPKGPSVRHLPTPPAPPPPPPTPL